MHATGVNNRHHLIIGADIPVVAVLERPGPAETVQTIIVEGAGVPVAARSRVVRERASVQGAARVGGANVVVVAGTGRADADPIQTRIVHGTGIVIGTDGPIRLTCAGYTAGRRRYRSHTIARDRVAGVDRAGI